jgi:hypothetical protein
MNENRDMTEEEAKLKVVMAQAYEAFCTLSDAQELISMGQHTEANNMINHAKLHLQNGADADRDTHRMAVGDMPITCSLPPELRKIAEDRGWL